jgi:hypothetical protein
MVEVRDAALAVLQRRGTLEAVAKAGGVKILSATVGYMRLAQRTPFQPPPRVVPGDLRRGAAARNGGAGPRLWAQCVGRSKGAYSAMGRV